MPQIIAFLGYDPEPEPQNLADRIVYFRRHLGLTQEALAELVSVDPVTVYRWEKSTSVPPAETLQKLQAFLRGKRKANPQ